MDTVTTFPTVAAGGDIVQNGINYKILNSLTFPNSIKLGATSYHWIILDTTCTYQDISTLPNSKKYFNDPANSISYLMFYQAAELAAAATYEWSPIMCPYGTSHSFTTFIQTDKTTFAFKSHDLPDIVQATKQVLSDATISPVTFQGYTQGISSIKDYTTGGNSTLAYFKITVSDIANYCGGGSQIVEESMTKILEIRIGDFPVETGASIENCWVMGGLERRTGKALKCKYDHSANPTIFYIYNFQTCSNSGISIQFLHTRNTKNVGAVIKVDKVLLYSEADFGTDTHYAENANAGATLDLTDATHLSTVDPAWSKNGNAKRVIFNTYIPGEQITDMEIAWTLPDDTTRQLVFQLPDDITSNTNNLTAMATTKTYTLEIWISTISTATSTTSNWHDWDGAKSECTLQVDFEVNGAYIGF